MLPVPTSAWMGHKANSVSEIFGRSQLVLYGVVVQENQFTIDVHQARRHTPAPGVRAKSTE